MALSAKWTPVFENEELAKKIVPMQPEEAQKVLAENGFEFTLDEILEAGKELYAIRNQQLSGEIDEEDLENVSGGVSIFVIGIVVQCAAKALSRW